MNNQLNEELKGSLFGIADYIDRLEQAKRDQRKAMHQRQKTNERLRRRNRELSNRCMELEELVSFYRRQDKKCKRQIASNGTTHYYQCSKCSRAIDVHDRYCRHCGAKVVE